MKNFFLLFFYLINICPIILFAQNNYSVKGSIADTVEHIKLANASVAVLNAKDSTLVGFIRASESGAFSFKGLHEGKFIILLSYPAYADFVENLSLSAANHEYNLGDINMSPKERILKEVIIKGMPVALKIKGDTTEFNAAAYTIQPNAKVEDLLKQLPGIQIDKDGKITAQGQAVNKVLVDGEEFFGDDPTLVTKNIRADMVDKVQLFDKKSDQATFTGIDDGKKTKAINIKLKSDKKNGVFGKTEEGLGTNGYYQSQVLYNAFRDKQKISVYGTLGNNGRVGLGWEDNQKYGSGDNLQFGDSGEIYITSGNNNDDLDSFDGRYNGQGIPLARAGGFHYDDKWNNDKESINANYKIGSINIDGTNINLTQNNLPGQVINSNSTQIFHNYMFRQKLDAVYQVKLDPSSDLKLSISGTQKHSNTKNSYTSSEMSNDTLINNNTRDLVNTVDQKALNATAFYTKKYKRAGRTFSLTINEVYSQSTANGFLNSDINFFTFKKDTSQIINQYKTNNLLNFGLNSNATFSEPLSKTFAIIFNYGIGIDNSSADRRSLNHSPTGEYNILIDSLSSNYKLNQLANQAGAIFNYQKGKTIITFGTRVVDIKFHQIDEYTSEALNRNFINWAPQASYQYRFSQQKSFRISYNGSTTQPNLEQIQPILTNTDPLNIVLGNPNLKPSFTNAFNINYNSYKVITGRFIGLYGSYIITTNPIVSSFTTDPTSGITVSRYLNLAGKQTSAFNFGGNYNSHIKTLGINAGLGINASGNIYYGLINGQLNKTENYVYSPRISLNKSVQKKYDFYLSAGPTYTIGQSSLQLNINNNGWGAKADGGFNIYLPGKFQIGMYDNYDYTAKTESFNQDLSRLILNAFIIKSFFKTDRLKLELWGNDLLNQNVGFIRNASANMIVQNSYTTIKRYFMLSISYDFTKMGGSTPKK